MCWYCCFHFHEESINQKLNSKEIKKNMTFMERMDLWMFFHTHPNIPKTNKTKDKGDIHVSSEVVTNPLREESIDVIIGDFNELHEFY